jgi:hypothetical protein
MRKLQSLVLGCAMVALLVCGLLLDEAAAQVPRCANPVVGCNNVPCAGYTGACPPSGSPTFSYIAQQGLTYSPCNVYTGSACPSPLVTRNTCWSGGFNLDAAGKCVNVCGWYYTTAAC